MTSGSVGARTHRRYEEAVEKILQLIADERLGPGSALPPERELAATLGMSRNVVRQSFSVLEERGLIVTRQGAGRYVRDTPTDSSAAITPLGRLETASIADILEARLILEVQVVSLACERRTLREAEMLVAAAKHLDTWEDNARFHSDLAAATHNFMLVQLVNQQARLLQSLNQREYYSSMSTWRDSSIEDHMAIAAAVLRRDSQDARSLIAKHLRHSQAAVFGDDLSSESLGSGSRDGPETSVLSTQPRLDA